MKSNKLFLGVMTCIAFTNMPLQPKKPTLPGAPTIKGSHFGVNILIEF
jgi:hypothetical protein